MMLTFAAVLFSGAFATTEKNHAYCSSAKTFVNKFLSKSAAFIPDADDSGNFAASPMSLRMVLSMALPASDSQSHASEQLSALLQTCDSDNRAQILGSVRKFVASKDKSDALTITNVAYTRNDLKTAFADTLRTSFDASVTTIPSTQSPSETAKDINNLIAKKTNDQIKHMVTDDDVAEKPLLLLLNVLYFKSAWMHLAGLKGIYPKNPFSLTCTNDIKVDYLVFDSKHEVVTGEVSSRGKRLYTYYTIPFQGHKYRMHFVVKGDGTERDDYNLNSAHLQEAVAALEATPKNFSKELRLPKFKIETPSMDLTRAVKDGLDLQAIFQGGAICPYPESASGCSGGVTKIVQKVVVDVDQAGVEASSATELVSLDRSRVSFEEINRPFIFIIEETLGTLATPLFVGIVKNPTGAGETGSTSKHTDAGTGKTTSRCSDTDAGGPIVFPTSSTQATPDKDHADCSSTKTFVKDFLSKSAATFIPDADTSGNLVVSPMSLRMALSMVLPASQLPASEKLSALLGSCSYEKRFQILNTVQEFVAASDKNNALTVTNVAYARNDLDEGYKYVLQKSFDATVTKIPSNQSPSETATDINSLIAKKTNDQIKNLVKEDDVSEDPLLLLLNVLYFKSAWMYSADPIGSNPTGSFFLTCSNMITVDYLEFNDNHQVVTGESSSHGKRMYKYYTIPFQGHKYRMHFVVKGNGTERDDYNLDSTHLQDAVAAIEAPSKKFLNTLRLPKFKIETGTMDLKDAVKDGLKLETIFQRGAICPYAGSGCSEVAKVLQKVVIDVNKDGVEASAATAVGIVTRSLVRPPVEEINRPFIFILEETNGALATPLFVGIVKDPTGAGETGRASKYIAAGSGETKNMCKDSSETRATVTAAAPKTTAATPEITATSTAAAPQTTAATPEITATSTAAAPQTTAATPETTAKSTAAAPQPTATSPETTATSTAAAPQTTAATPETKATSTSDASLMTAAPQGAKEDQNGAKDQKTEGSKDEGLSPGVLIGIVFGVVFFLILLIAALFFCGRKKRDPAQLSKRTTNAPALLTGEQAQDTSGRE